MSASINIRINQTEEEPRDRKDKEKDKDKSKNKRRITRKSLKSLGKNESVLSKLNEKTKNLRTLSLSPMTQIFIECRVGQNVTPENPWNYVNKEKILDHLELHEHSSEFLPIKQYMLQYPEPNIYVGCYSYAQDSAEEFYICTTVDAKNDILDHLELERNAVIEKLLKCINISCKKWVSIGSEDEVDENMIHNTRPLIEYEINTRLPVFKERISFKCRLVEHAKDGYVELLPNRFTYTNIFRKCIDSSAQVTPLTKDIFVQTEVLPFHNRHTQYEYEYQQLKMNTATVKKLNNFLNDQCSDVSNIIEFNSCINIYCDDYAELPNQMKASYFPNPINIFSFQDVVNCKDKRVSCVSWNPLISGIVAASYIKTPINSIRKSEPIGREVMENIFDSNFVLVWCYTDPIRPKLYCHAYREVTTVSFCPYNGNILLGGCNNGQIYVWDLTNRLAQVETRELVTPQEIKNRTSLLPLTDWFKRPLDISHILPTAISNLDYCHRSSVMDIKWLPPDHYINRNGKYQKCEDDESHMQFLTCSKTDSTVLVWDLMVEKYDHEKYKVKQTRWQRLSEVPAAFAVDISPLKKMQKNHFIPVFQIVLQNSSTKQKVSITNIILKNQQYTYKAINPETQYNYSKKTYFEVETTKDAFDFEQCFYVTSVIGNILRCSWDGHEFNQGQKINTELCNSIPFMTAHDGPVHICCTNPADPTILLTVGGTVFAIWDTTRNKVPIYWRKSKVKLVSGLWSMYNSFAIIIVRVDSYLEFWNLLKCSKVPTRILKYTGSSPINLYSDKAVAHVKKGTFLNPDINGSLKVYFVSAPFFELEESITDNMRQLLENIRTRKEKRKFWIDSLHGKAECLSVEDGTENKVSEELNKDIKLDKEVHIERKKKSVTKKRIQSLLQSSAKNIWQQNKQTEMYLNLIERNRLNLQEIEQNKKPLLKKLDEKNSKLKKIEQFLVNKQEYFDNIRKSLVQEVRFRNRKNMNISVDFPKEVTTLMKTMYLQNYASLETETLKHISNNKFHYACDWDGLMFSAKQQIRNEKCRRLHSVVKFSTIHERSEPLQNLRPSEVKVVNIHIDI